MVFSRRLRVQNCTTTLGPQGIYPAPPRPVGISPAQRAGTPSVFKTKKILLVSKIPADALPVLNLLSSRDKATIAASICETAAAFTVGLISGMTSIVSSSSPAKLQPKMCKIQVFMDNITSMAAKSVISETFHHSNIVASVVQQLKIQIKHTLFNRNQNMPNKLYTHCWMRMYGA